MRPPPPALAWPLAAALAAAAMLTTAHVFQHFGYAPCTLCLRQREVYWGALAVAAAGLALWRMGRLSLDVLSLLLGAVFLTGAVIAAYHAGAEWKWWPGPTACSGAGGAVTTDDLTMLLAGTARVKPPACDEAAWRMLGLSMAGWNMLVSLVLAAVGLAVARRGGDR